jgi:hypothetical protein
LFRLNHIEWDKKLAKKSKAHPDSCPQLHTFRKMVIRMISILLTWLSAVLSSPVGITDGLLDALSLATQK